MLKILKNHLPIHSASQSWAAFWFYLELIWELGVPEIIPIYQELVDWLLTTD